MANIKQQAKRNLTNEKRRLQNAAFKSSVRTAVKNVETAVANKNLEQAQEALKLACTKLDKALAKGIFHKNFVSRNKSRLAKLLNSLA
ncbi:MAG TPA: 30S ribosomal protein S20 [Bacilli bacterium]|jgi:small subunit ribosomal protein S20|nr:30S ribosomal protein S20 [Bacilli bacterium]NLT01341.1 30S ribosomal protein S20 [Acholeplasmataceae bacterium]HNZ77794.1 30S ribosomal protein S20 [Bacilli bacterium]HOD60937.1 30S ribosomal protein S20 [Bacilli bacterium]HOE07138.1 30S ribosomal protein S20 [Bacilli bacterium]